MAWKAQVNQTENSALLWNLNLSFDAAERPMVYAIERRAEVIFIFRSACFGTLPNFFISQEKTGMSFEALGGRIWRLPVF